MAQLSTRGRAAGESLSLAGVRSDLARHRPDIRVAVLEDSGRIVGFLPYQKSPLGIGRGLAYGLGNGHGLVAPPDFAWHAGDVLKRCGLAVWEFDYLPAHEARFLGHTLVPRHPRLSSISLLTGTSGCG